MIYAPRASLLSGAGGFREGRYRFQSVRVNSSFNSALFSPAYSIGSNVVACGFNDFQDGQILTRRVPELTDGKETPSLRLSGGAAWCPTNNKFYHGAARLNQPTGDGMCVVIDPEIERFEVITGFPTDNFSANGGRCIYIPTTGEIWMRFGYLGDGWAVINPADNSFELVPSATAFDFTYVPGNDAIYFSTGGEAWKMDVQSRAATLVYDQDTLHGGSVSAHSVGPIEFIDSLGKILFYIKFTSGVTTLVQRIYIDPSDDSITFDTADPSDNMPAAAYYTSEFDRLILSWAHTGPALNPNLYSIDPSDFSSATVISSDRMLSAKGCYCDGPDKIALAVNSSTVKFYGAADL